MAKTNEQVDAQEPTPTFDTYVSAVDRIHVVHVETELLPEDHNGPRIRVYLNDGKEAIYANPPLADGER